MLPASGQIPIMCTCVMFGLFSACDSSTTQVRCQDMMKRYVFAFLLGARAFCPRRRDEGGTPLLRGAYVTPGVNSYEDQRTKALQAGGALPGDAFFRHALASHLWFKVSGCPTLYRVVFWQASAYHLPFQASGCPTSPFSPCRRRGSGG